MAMILRDWFRPPRQLLTFYLAGTIAAAAALTWLGWRMLEQERALEAQRAQERLEIMCDRVTAIFQRSLDELAKQLSAPAAMLPADAILMTADRKNMQTQPAQRLVFYSVAAEAAGPPAGIFQDGETAEFAGSDLVKAISIYRRLARTDERLVKAAALMRLGRCLRKAGRPDEALQTYEDLARLGATPVEGIPAELVAREARCCVLETMGRRDLLEREAAGLYHDLAAGHWQIGYAAWSFFLEEARKWAGSSAVPPPGLAAAISLSTAADSLLGRWAELPPSGQAASMYAGLPVLAVWIATEDRLTVVLTGTEYFETLRLQAANEAQVKICLSDQDGRILAGGVAAPLATRTAAATSLPFTIQVSSANPRGDLNEAGTRRRMLLAGLAILGTLILGSGYFTFRGIRRELAVARLQSDFVSAVSHEFRTPLTSLRQLSQMLFEGRIISEDRRQQYYGVLARESERLARLVEELLNFGRAEAGAMRYVFGPVDLGELIRSVAGEFQCQADTFQVEVTLPADPCRIRADREMMSLALWNLLDNAMKYSPECRTAWVDLSRNETHAAISVRDRGIGVPQHEHRRIFKKFVRGEGISTLGVKGAGIGLAMVEHVAKAHGGRVRLESEAGRGSTFTLLLPLENAK